MVKGLKKLPHESRLKKLGIGLYSLGRRRLSWDIQVTNWKRTCQMQQILWTGIYHQRTQRTLVEAIQTKMSYNNQTTSWVHELSTSGTSYHKKSSRHRRSTRSRTGWIDTGTIWAFSADWPHSPLTSSTSTSNKNSSGHEIANVNVYAVRSEATLIRWNNAK